MGLSRCTHGHISEGAHMHACIIMSRHLCVKYVPFPPNISHFLHTCRRSCAAGTPQTLWCPTPENSWSASCASTARVASTPGCITPTKTPAACAATMSSLPVATPPASATCMPWRAGWTPAWRPAASAASPYSWQTLGRTRHLGLPQPSCVSSVGLESMPRAAVNSGTLHSNRAIGDYLHARNISGLTLGSHVYAQFMEARLI